MIILLVLLLMIIYFLGSLKINTYRSLVTLFTFFWAINLIISKYFMPQLYPVHNTTYLIICAYVFFVLLGYFSITGKINKNIQKDDIEDSILIDNIYSIIIQILLFIILLNYYIKFSQLTKEIPEYMLRLSRYSVGLLFKRPIELLFFNYVVSPLVELFGLLSIVRIVLFNKKNVVILISILNLFLFSFIGLGRFGLFNSLVFIATAFLFKSIFRIDVFTKKNNNKGLLVLISSILAMMLYLGMLRGIGDEGVVTNIKESFSQFWIYFSGPHRTLDYFLQTGNTHFYFGRAFISGLDEIFILIISIMGVKVSSVNTVIASLTSPALNIGPDQYFNAFYTGIFNSYLDGGMLFLIIESVILGVIAGIIWNYSFKKTNIYSFSLIVYFNLILISTSYRFEFQQFKSFIIIFILIYLSEREAFKNGEFKKK